MTGQKIRLLIVDDHPLFRQGVRLFLQEITGIEVVGEVGDGESALSFLVQQEVDVVLLDLLMPGLDGTEVAGQVSRRWPKVKVLILTSFGSWHKAYAALKAGAAGYVQKDAEPAELLAAIQAVAAGGSYLGARMAAEMLSHVGNEENVAQEQSTHSLTEREKEVLTLIARGLGNREIGEKLFVSEKTVKTHVANILQKLGVKSRTQAAMYAMRAGLADMEDGHDA